jgi:AsmA protein
MPRIIIWLIAIPLVLVITAAILLPILIDEKQLVEMASQTLKEQTGAELTVSGGASLSLFPSLELQVQQAALSLPEGDDSSLAVDSLSIGVQLMPLLSQELVIDTIGLSGLVVQLVTEAGPAPLDTSGFNDQQLDAYYQQREKLRKSAASANSGTILAAPLALNIGQMTITDSRIEQLDPASGERSVIEIHSFTASDLNLDARPMPVALQLTMPQGEGEPLTVELSGDLRVDTAAQLLYLDQLSTVVGGALPTDITAVLKGQVELTKRIADLQIKLDLGEAHGEGKLRYAEFESPAIDTSLHFNLLDPALFALAGPEAAQAGSQDDSSSGDNSIPLDTLRKIDSRVDLKVDRAVMDAHAVENLHAKIRALDGFVKIISVTGKLHGGDLNVNGNLNGKKSTFKMNLQGTLQGMDIPAVLKAVESDPLFSGNANVDWKLNSQGNTPDALMLAMKGPVNLQVQEGVLEDMGIQKMLCEAVALANGQALASTLPERTQFDQLSVKLKLEDGKLKLSPLTATLQGAALKGEGRMTLLDQSFSGKFAAKLTPALAQLDPACKINERYTSISWPVACKGNLADDPADWCGVDTDDILAELTTNEAKRKLEKEAGRLFDKLLNK